MNSFGANVALVLLCLVVMATIWAIIALISFARREWPTAREVDKLQHDRLHQRLEEITSQTTDPKQAV